MFNEMRLLLKIFLERQLENRIFWEVKNRLESVQITLEEKEFNQNNNRRNVNKNGNECNV